MAPAPALLRLIREEEEQVERKKKDENVALHVCIIHHMMGNRP